MIVGSIYSEQLQEHGGLPGVRDENALESALSVAWNKLVYGEERNFTVLAAAGGFCLCGPAAISTFTGPNFGELLTATRKSES